MPTPRQHLACDFLAYLQGRAKARVDLTQKEDWIDGAVTTTKGAGNPTGSVVNLCEDAKAQLVRGCEDLITALRHEPIVGQTTFDQVLFETISRVERGANPHVDTTLFTFGRSQKFVTISLKYCYVWWFCKKQASPCYGDLDWVDKWAPHFHVPVDNFTLKHLSETPHGHIAVSGNTVISWKWHLTRSRYCRIQDAIRNLVKSGDYDDPIHYEMDRIWTRAEEEGQ